MGKQLLSRNISFVSTVAAVAAVPQTECGRHPQRKVVLPGLAEANTADEGGTGKPQIS
jgi:hypothetical protein